MASLALFSLQARPRSKRLKGKPPDWEDPTVFARNTLAAHTPLHSFESTHAALEFWRQRPKDRCEASSPARRTMPERHQVPVRSALLGAGTTTTV